LFAFLPAIGPQKIGKDLGIEIKKIEERMMMVIDMF
jgi:hypothetical protein